MIIDSMDLAGPAAQSELEILKTTKVGTVLHGGLFPALEVGIEWTCTAVLDGRWEFDGQFFGQPLFRVAVVIVADRLQLETL